MYVLNFGAKCLESKGFHKYRDAVKASKDLPDLWFIIKVESDRSVLKACNLKGCSYDVINFISQATGLKREEIEAIIYNKTF